MNTPGNELLDELPQPAADTSTGTLVDEPEPELTSPPGILERDGPSQSSSYLNPMGLFRGNTVNKCVRESSG